MNGRSNRSGDPAGVIAGALFISIGLLSVVLSYGWRVGTAAQMGPGYFPLMLGGILIVLGISIAGRAHLASGRAGLPPMDLKAVLPIICPIILFAAVVSTAGLLVSIIGLVVLTRLADRTTRLVETLALASFLSLLVTLVFVVGLGVRVPLLPPFATGWFG
jgi:hypothetical protein